MKTELVVTKVTESEILGESFGITKEREIEIINIMKKFIDEKIEKYLKTMKEEDMSDASTSDVIIHVSKHVENANELAWFCFESNGMITKYIAFLAFERLM